MYAALSLTRLCDRELLSKGIDISIPKEDWNKYENLDRNSSITFLTDISSIPFVPFKII